MTQKTQIIFIHGGMTFKSRKDYLDFLKTREVNIEPQKKWYEDYLDKELGKDYEITRLKMPLKENARYEDWKIHFERHFSYLRDDIILIGGSLGGIFLAKYLSEHKFPKKIQGVFLVCPPFDNTVNGEHLDAGFKLSKDLSLIEENTENLYLMFSEDDDIVPVSHAEKYRAKLKNANIIVYKSKNGHFKVSEFPEIVKMIKNLVLI